VGKTLKCGNKPSMEVTLCVPCLIVRIVYHLWRDQVEASRSGVVWKLKTHGGKTYEDRTKKGKRQEDNLVNLMSVDILFWIGDPQVIHMYAIFTSPFYFSVRNWQGIHLNLKFSKASVCLLSLSESFGVGGGGGGGAVPSGQFIPLCTIVKQKKMVTLMVETLRKLFVNMKRLSR
jgi:hypothetical protein